MGLLDLLGRKRARDKPRNSYEGQAFSYLFGRTTSWNATQMVQNLEGMGLTMVLLVRDTRI